MSTSIAAIKECTRHVKEHSQEDTLLLGGNEAHARTRVNDLYIMTFNAFLR